MTNDDLQAARVEALAATTVKQLDDIYERVVGYRPSVDDPSMAFGDVLELLLEHLDEAQAAA